MAFFAKRKRKNDESSPFPAWLIVLVALGIVIVAVMLFRPAGRSNTASDVNQPSGNIELTATAIIQEATAMAQGTPQPVASDLDPFELTATYIVQQVTAIAQGTPQPGS